MIVESQVFLKYPRLFIRGLVFHASSLRKPSRVCPNLPTEFAYTAKIHINSKNGQSKETSAVCTRKQKILL